MTDNFERPIFVAGDAEPDEPAELRREVSASPAATGLYYDNLDNLANAQIAQALAGAGE